MQQWLQQQSHIEQQQVITHAAVIAITYAAAIAMTHTRTTANMHAAGVITHAAMAAVMHTNIQQYNNQVITTTVLCTLNKPLLLCNKHLGCPIVAQDLPSHPCSCSCYLSI